jgi:hypothetical protein
VSFIYPRTVSIRRPSVDNAVGAQPYSGLTEANETQVAGGLPASIQLARKGGAPDAGTPSDSYGRVTFNIFIPARAAALGLITENDIVVDDLAKRYQVSGAYWNSLGYNLTADLLSP